MFAIDTSKYYLSFQSFVFKLFLFEATKDFSVHAVPSVNCLTYFIATQLEAEFPQI